MTRRILAFAATVFLLGAHGALAQQPQPQPQQRPATPAPAQPRPAAPAAAPAGPTELPPNGTSVVICDVLLVLREAKASQSIREQIDKQRASYQAEIAKQENELRAADQQLASQRAILAPEAFAQRRRDLEKRVGDAQQAVQGRRRSLDQAFTESMQRVEGNMIEVISEIARDKNYQVVLPKSQVVIVQTQLDITQEVLQRLNKKVASVPVTIPKN
jgi:Skp family chaperone for outer membrane proteins